MANSLHSENNKPIVLWLFTCAFTVFAMMIIGAITRLSEAGLSMVEWRPLIGALPPLNEEEWQRVFDLYQQSPEYLKKNSWMNLDDFKSIFFWEWFHRLWGRLIGIVFALPLIFFWVRKIIPPGYHLKFLGLLALGGAQGFMGWYMVKSGLVDVPAVSHYRLAAHLGLAFIIITALLWSGLSLTLKTRRVASAALHVHGWITLAFIAITICWGAFTAGLDAGLVYNETFPKMGGAWVPPDFWQHETLWANIVENHSVIQFTHRWLAIGTLIMVSGFWLHGMMRGLRFRALHAAMLVALIQLALGIATLLSGVHLHIAVAHQAGAIILWGLMIICLYQTRPVKQSVQA
ncbi:MAG: COX15/CtaA family protein [Rhodospirillales bacterium]|nr:COX15/CtaA family protein [Rhodospirillales bacterium]